MLLVIASSLLLHSLLGGWGALGARALRLAPRPNPWLTPLIGLFAAGTVASAASLLVPLDGRALCLFILIGLAGLPAWAREIRAIPSGSRRTLFILALFAAGLLLAVKLAKPEWPGRAYDADLYHANAVSWMNEYGTPPGLANLHSRLGQSSSLWLTVAALFDNGPWDGRSAWLMPALLALLTLPYLLHNLLFDENQELRAYSLCLLPFVALNFFKTFPHLYYDDAALYLAAVSAGECLRLRRDDPDCGKTLRLIVCLAAAAFCIKQMAAPGVVFTGLAALFILKKNHRLSPAGLGGVFLPAAGAAAVWAARNALLSGYPLFPLPVLPLPVDWLTPPEMVVGNYEAIVGWARAPGPGYGEALNNWSWLGAWLRTSLTSLRALWNAVLPLTLGTLAWIVLLVRRRRGGREFFFLAWSSGCMVFWFLSAPDLRFGAVFMQVFFALGAAILWQLGGGGGRLDALLRLVAAGHAVVCRHGRLSRISRPALPRVAGLTLVLAAAAAFSLASKLPFMRRISWISVGVMPARPLKSQLLDAGPPPILLYTPIQDDRCGNSPLPCTPFLDSRLRLRAGGELGRGFYMEPE